MPSPKEDIIYRTGELILIWGDIEAYWYLIFTCILEDTKRTSIDAIYNFLKSALQKEG